MVDPLSLIFSAAGSAFGQGGLLGGGGLLDKFIYSPEEKGQNDLLAKNLKNQETAANTQNKLATIEGLKAANKIQSASINQQTIIIVSVLAAFIGVLVIMRKS